MLRPSSLLYLFLLLLLACKTETELAPRLVENQLWVQPVYIFTDEHEAALLAFSPEGEREARLRVQRFAEIEKLKSARFVVCGISEEAPQGFLAKIESHSTLGDITEFQLRAASFPEVIRRGEINLEGKLGTLWTYEDVQDNNTLSLELDMNLKFSARYDEDGRRAYDALSFSSKTVGESFLSLNMRNEGVWEFQQALKIAPKSREFWLKTHDGRDFPLVISSTLEADLYYHVENFGGNLSLNSPLFLTDEHGFHVENGNVRYPQLFWTSLWGFSLGEAQWDIPSGMGVGKSVSDSRVEYWFYNRLSSPEHTVKAENGHGGIRLDCGAGGRAGGYFSGDILGLRGGHSLWRLTGEEALEKEADSDQGYSGDGLPMWEEYPCKK